MKKRKLSQIESYIRHCFYNYKENKKISRLTDDQITANMATNYDKVGNSGSVEQDGKVINLISKTEESTKMCALVERVQDWFSIEGRNADRYIQYRFIDGHTQISSSIYFHMSDRTVRRMEQDIFEVALRILETRQAKIA